jgi:predicted metal-dependent HD superfamily phosphohydrolase
VDPSTSPSDGTGLTSADQARLHPAWIALLHPFTLDGAAAESAFTTLTAAYAEPHRAYHTLAHIAAVLATLDTLRDGADDWPALELAAWFHDVVYDPRRADNEAQSAAVARRTLTGLGVPAALIDHVAALIRQTQAHEPDPGDPDAPLLLDADLAILGAAPAAYAAYAAAIRREYAWVPDADYRRGRAAILRHFLARPRLYHTAALFAAREAPARRNLAAELATLA